MDPPTLLNKGSFNLAEIWPSFQLNGCGGLNESNVVNGFDGGLELRISQFGESLCRLADDVERANADDCIGAARQRADAAGPGDGNGTNENNESKRIKTSGSKESKVNARKPVEPSKQDYIHVRARRGQATDSHSLAERARREKISERMKILQDLVPGCNKVIGKTLVLDEISNCIQTLQHQVEFLSIKLEAVNSNSNLDVSEFPNKQVTLTQLAQQTIDSGTMAFSLQPSREYAHGLSPEWQHMQVGGGFERTMNLNTDIFSLSYELLSLACPSSSCSCDLHNFCFALAATLFDVEGLPYKFTMWIAVCCGQFIVTIL